SCVPGPPVAPLFPYATLFRSVDAAVVLRAARVLDHRVELAALFRQLREKRRLTERRVDLRFAHRDVQIPSVLGQMIAGDGGHDRDRKSTRLNSSHVKISYAVF